MARDLHATEDFYGAVMGWTFRPGSLGEKFSVALKDGAEVAGIGALAPSLQVAVSWTPYFAVGSADIAVARIRERGATVAVGPLALGGVGRAALAADPDGAVFGVWEGAALSGWSVGWGSAPAWLELRTRDAFAAAIFYGEVLDWVSEKEGGGCEAAYEDDRVVLREGGRTVAALRGGGVEADPDPRVRPRWDVHFRVDDVDAATEAAVDAGGVVVSPSVRTGPGRQAAIRDPDGGLFTITTS
ncbi:VOC family protein [Wenjunlia tyrosinilytica]|nr:VOC family protein [Wenjunlia tyrosinilytica]